MHNGLIMTANVIWNPLTPKSLATDWISIISGNSYDFLVDTNDIFSNVIDLDDFDGDSVLSLLNEDKSRNNIIVCVSPYYREATRGKRMKEFGDKLQGYTLVYKLEKHTDDWDKPYSCQIYIFVSSYYWHFALNMFVLEYYWMAFSGLKWRNMFVFRSVNNG